MINLNKTQKIFLVVVLILIFFLIYRPHFNYPFPYHIDEWHHITETIKLGQGQMPFGPSGLEAGFHFLLLPLTKITSLVLIYKFLPAIWAVLSALTLFYVVYKKTKNNFFIALLAIIFFASIKTNVNLTGLWFFTPLTFSIPFIFLYFYFFTQGVEEQKKKSILISLALMIFLIPIHAISVLFALPILIIYLLANFSYFKKEWRFFLSLITIPIIGLIFYQIITQTPWSQLLNQLIANLQFKSGWGVLELKNSFTEVYSLTGYILALISLSWIFIKRPKKYLICILWPTIVLINIFVYRLNGVSYLAPYQRNLYYLVLAMPFLSALGLYGLINTINKLPIKKYLKKIAIILIIILVIYFSFINYYKLPKQTRLYHIIDQNDYQTLIFLSHLPPGKVMALPFISTAMYAISGHQPVGTIAFYGHREKVRKFFLSENCAVKQNIINQEKISYVIFNQNIDCGWKLIYNKNNYIYQIPPWK